MVKYHSKHQRQRRRDTIYTTQKKNRHIRPLKLLKWLAKRGFLLLPLAIWLSFNFWRFIVVVVVWCQLTSFRLFQPSSSLSLSRFLIRPKPLELHWLSRFTLLLLYITFAFVRLTFVWHSPKCSIENLFSHASLCIAMWVWGYIRSPSVYKLAILCDRPNQFSFLRTVNSKFGMKGTQAELRWKKHICSMN